MSQIKKFKEKLHAGGYTNLVNAKRALGQLDIGERVRSNYAAEAEVYFSKAETPSTPTYKPRRSKRTTVRAKASGSSDNGAKEDLSVTILKLLSSKERENVLYLLGKAIDDNIAIHDVYQRVKDMDAILGRLLQGR